jgi:CRISPR-associated protein Csm4
VLNLKINWKLKSALSTSLESDTIFGHFCWALKYLKGEKKLIDFINQLLEGKACFKLSNGFKKGYIPFSQVIPHSKTFSDRLEVCYRLKKEIKTIDLISIKKWNDNCNHFNPEIILDNNLDNKEVLLSSKSGVQNHRIIHNYINRLSGTTSKDGANLFAEETSFYSSDYEFNSWLKTDYFALNELKEIFCQISVNGFGKDKNFGRGTFDILVEESKDFTVVNDCNSWLLISNCVPCKDDSTNVMAEAKVKYPKTGGDYALKESPYKYPVYVFTPTTIFIGEKEPQGMILRNIHPFNDKIIQNLSAYCLPIKISEELLWQR